MTIFRTPNFRGWNALIIHRHDDNAARLTRQLERLGMQVTVAWPDMPEPAPTIDVVFVDGDNGFDGLFPWPPGEPAVPLIALIGSEAPGRLEWVLGQGAAAHLVKPVQSSGVFSALVLASATFERMRAMRQEIFALGERIAKRPLVFSALAQVMAMTGLDENQAYALLRSEAMRRRQPVEHLCEALLQGKLIDAPAFYGAAARLRRG